MDVIKKLFGMLLLSFLNILSYACCDFDGRIPIQIGGVWIKQGVAQDIAIDTLVGNHFSINNNGYQGSAFFGVGYLREWQKNNLMDIDVGINALYFSRTMVSGIITQEQLFTNLAYTYNVNNIPVYVWAKGNIKTNNDKYVFTTELGIGPNFITTSGYRETSLDGGVTIPDNAFYDSTKAAFSGLIGVGVQINEAFGPAAAECGLRLFYFNHTTLKKRTTQLVNGLATNNSFAPGFFCGLIM